MMYIIVFVVVSAASFVGWHFAFEYFKLQVDLKEANQKVESLEKTLAKKIVEVRE